MLVKSRVLLFSPQKTRGIFMTDMAKKVCQQEEEEEEEEEEVRRRLK